MPLLVNAKRKHSLCYDTRQTWSSHGTPGARTVSVDAMARLLIRRSHLNAKSYDLPCMFLRHSC